LAGELGTNSPEKKQKTDQLAITKKEIREFIRNPLFLRAKNCLD